MSLHGADWVLILLAVAVGFAACYLLLLARLQRIVCNSNLKVADRMAALDDAIRALETRVSESYAALAGGGFARIQAQSANDEKTDEADAESENIPAEIQAVIAAAAVAAVGDNAAVRSIRSLSADAVSPWSQQGRAMVQGSHNLRVRR